jgi:hypothetical protein
MNKRLLLPLIAALSGLSFGGFPAATSCSAAPLPPEVTMLAVMDQTDKLAAQITFWSEPLIMLVLGLALLIIATSVRLWGRKKSSATLKQSFRPVEKNGEQLPLFSAGKVAVEKEERWPS